MAPRSKTRTTQNILLGIAAATTLAAGLVWAYQNLSNSSEEEGSNEVSLIHSVFGDVVH